MTDPKADRSVLALAEYERVCNAALANYERVCNAAWAEYQRAIRSEP